MSELRKIPNVGAQTERDLLAMGYATIDALRGKSADELYAQECALRGETLDRCQLYLLRAVEYFVNTKDPDPHKCKWWYWTDEALEPSPCGTVCLTDCPACPQDCKGCRAIEGEVYWLPYIGGDCCPIYHCCVHERGARDCGGCERLPCAHWELRDPTMTDEEIERGLQKRLRRLETNSKK